MGKDLKGTYTFRVRSNEEELIKKFLVSQSNFCDAIRYLIEEEIKKNGVRDISKYIPAYRTVFDGSADTERAVTVESVNFSTPVTPKYEQKNPPKKASNPGDEVLTESENNEDPGHRQEETKGNTTEDKIIENAEEKNNKAEENNHVQEETINKHDESDEEDSKFTIPECYR